VILLRHFALLQANPILTSGLDQFSGGRPPAPGVILSIADRSVGSVVTQAEPLFTIVPADVPMEMEVDVLPKDVGLIQVGDLVRIKLDALPFQKHGTSSRAGCA
jgi:multidrug resistance efflux pump